MKFCGCSWIIVALLVFSAQLILGAPRSRRARLTREAATDEVDADGGSARQNKLTDAFNAPASKTTITKSRDADEPRHTARRNKALNFFGFFPDFFSSDVDYGEDDDDVTFSVSDDRATGNEDLSRTLPPSRRRDQNKDRNSYPNDMLNSIQYDNSPIFYIRLPPTPYMFVPGLGYVSQPPQLGLPVPPPPPPPPVDPFINLPVDFVSNGKPTNVYQWAGAPQFSQQPLDPFASPYRPPAPARPSRPSRPLPPRKTATGAGDSKVTNLKGPYVFNGKPGDSVLVLRDSYNSLYSDALQNFYP